MCIVLARFASFADELVWCEALQRLEWTRVIVGGDKLAEMLSQVVVGIVVVSLDSRVF